VKIFNFGTITGGNGGAGVGGLGGIGGVGGAGGNGGDGGNGDAGEGGRGHANVFASDGLGIGGNGGNGGNLANGGTLGSPGLNGGIGGEPPNGGTGGTGGFGFDGGSDSGFGVGGNGGAGVEIDADPSSSNIVLDNVGIITGGNGGVGFTPGFPGFFSGSGGPGVLLNASNATINNFGTISGGTGLFGRADSILINGSNDRVNLFGFAVLNGEVNKNSGTTNSDVLNFAFSGLKGAPLATLTSELSPFLTGTETSGSIVFRGHTFGWDNMVVELHPTFFADLGLCRNDQRIGAVLDGITSEPSQRIENLMALILLSRDPDRALNQLFSTERFALLGDIPVTQMTFVTQEIDHRLNNMRDGSEACVGPECPAPAPAPAPIYSKGGYSKESKEVAPPPPPPSEKIFDVWAAANTVFADLEEHGCLSDQKFSSWGFILGADVRIGDHWIAGAFANYDRTWANLDLDKEGSRADIDSGGGGLYAGYQNGGWYGHGLFEYTHSWDDVNRNIKVPVDFLFQDTEISSTQNNAYGANLDGGYDWCLGCHGEAPAPAPQSYSKDGKDGKNVALPPAEACVSHWTIGLLAGLQYVHVDVDGFSEHTASNNTNFCPECGPEFPGPSLAVDEQNLDSLRSRLGGRLTYHVLNCEGWAFAVEGRAAWQHEFLDDSRTISGTLIDSGLPSFDIRTRNPERDSALVGGGLNITWRNRYTVFGDYDAQVGQSDFLAQSVKFGAKISF